MPDDYTDALNAAFGTPRASRRRYTFEEADPLISQYESGNRNIRQNIVGPRGGFNPSVGRVTGPSSAQGPWIIPNQTWGKYAPSVGAGQYKSAMEAPVETQRQVARAIYEKEGFAPWSNFNAALRGAINRGETARQRPIQSPAQPAQEGDIYKGALDAAFGAGGRSNR